MNSQLHRTSLEQIEDGDVAEDVVGAEVEAEVACRWRQ